MTEVQRKPTATIRREISWAGHAVVLRSSSGRYHLLSNDAGVSGTIRGRRTGVRRLAATVALAGLVLLTVGATLPYNFPRQFYAPSGPRWQYVEHTVAGEALCIPVWQVQAIQMFQGVIARHQRPGARFFIGPYEAGMYSVLGQTSPIWNSYLVYPEMESRQLRMIQELETNDVGLALINDLAAVDGKSIYRFRNSHPLVWQHLCARYRVVPEDGLPPGWVVFRRDQ
jgi:hypothetical protein